MKFAANLTVMFQEAGNLLNRYEAAANFGFKFVECAFPYSENVELLKNVKEKYNLEQVLINTPIGLTPREDKGLACLPDKVSDFHSSIQQAIHYAKILQCPRIHVMSGKYDSNESTEKIEKTYLENLQYASEEMQKENLTCLIEPINAISIPGYFLNSYDQAIRYLNLLQDKCPNLKLQLDIFHLQMICGNLTNNIKRLLPYTGHIQIAQAPDRHEPDSPGEINYDYVIELISNLKYSGFVGCEYVPATNTVSGLSWIRKHTGNMI